MKVLIAVTRGTHGGIGNHFAVLREHIPSDIEYFEVGRAPGERGHLSMFWRLAKDFLRFRKVLKTGSYDLVHINPSMIMKAIMRDGLLLLIAKRCGKPVVVFMHGWDVGDEETIRRWFLGLFRRVYSQADLVMVLGDVFRRKLREMGIESRIVKVTTLVKDEVFSEDVTAMANHPSAPTDLHLLFLSRLDIDKGLQVTIEAYRSIVTRYPGLILTIVGDGPERERIQALVDSEKLTGVRIRGYIAEKEKAKVFTDADIYIFPTMAAEGMPASLLEAMSFGLPVITRPVGGIQDFFEDGRMGYVTESIEPTVFAELIAKLLSDPDKRAEMGEYNRRYAMERFQASKVAARLTALYADTLGGTK